MSSLAVMGSRETTVLLTRQPLRGCAAELWALTSTCSRQPPPRLRESSLVSTAACGPGYSRGGREALLPTAGPSCGWPHKLQAGLSHINISGQSMQIQVFALRYADVSVHTYMCTPSAHMHTCLLSELCSSLHTPAWQVSYVLRTQRHRDTNADRFMQIPADSCMYLSLWAQNRYANVYLKYTCPNMCSLLRTHTG